MSAAKGSKGDTARNELIRLGATVSALATIFACDPSRVRRVVAEHNLVPVLNASNQELYPIRMVAPYLVDISDQLDVEQLIKSVSIRKLPPELTKVYWEAMNARKKHMEDDGELWRTEAIMEVLLDVFSTIRQSINQFNDTIDNRVQLSHEQRRLIFEMTDGLLASTREKLIQQFELYAPSTPEKDEEAAEFREDG